MAPPVLPKTFAIILMLGICMDAQIVTEMEDSPLVKRVNKNLVLKNSNTLEVGISDHITS